MRSLHVAQAPPRSLPAAPLGMRCLFTGVQRCISTRCATNRSQTALILGQRWFRVTGPMGRAVQPSSSSAAAAASQQQAGSMDAAQPAATHPVGVSVDITRDNFWAMLPLVKEALERCTFFAFDLEMTGLFLPDNRHQYLDDFEERYAKVAASAASFQITQFGLSCFEPAAPTPADGTTSTTTPTTTSSSSSSGGGAWAARTFNFWVFPSPGRHTAAPTFVCEASSMAFLSSQGFNFNTWVAQGIPYLPASLRDSLLERVQSKPLASLDNGEGAGVLGQANDSDRELLAGVLTQVEAWLAAGDAAEQQQKQEEDQQEQQQELEDAPMNGTGVEQEQQGGGQQNGVAAQQNGSQQQQAAPDTQAAAAAPGGRSSDSRPQQQQQQGVFEEMFLPPMTSWQRLLVYHQLSAAPWVADRGGHSGVWVSKADQGRWARLRVVRATAARAAELEAEDIARRRREVEEAAGFAAVMALLRESGKPAVGHNLMFDLAYTLHSFASGSLPSSWEEFKALARAWFPGGLYDTKYIATHNSKPFPSTALGELYQHLYFNSSSNGRSNNNSSRNGNGTVSNGTGSNGSSSWAPPCSARHAAGYDKYAALPPGAAAHEAGYDAFMTGACFAALAAQRAAAAAAAQPPAAATDVVGAGGSQPAVANGAIAAAGVSPGTEPAAAAAAAADVVAVLQPYVGRVPLGRSDIPYASLFGVDVLPERPRVFYVEGLPLDRPYGVLNRALAPMLQAMQVMVTPVKTRGGLLVDLDSTAAAALQQRLAAAPEGVLTATAQLEGQSLQVTIQPWQRQAVAAQEGRGKAGAAPLKRKAEALPGAAPEAAAAPQQRRRLDAAQSAADEEEGDGDRRKGLCCIM